MATSLDGLLPFLAEKVAPLCHAIFEVDSCIASTNVAAHVCEYFGLGAFPQQVRVQVYNPRAAEKVRTEGNDGRFDGTDGAYGLLIAGTGKFGDGRWDGHLVAVVPFFDDLFVLDMTVAQFARPEWDIVVPSAAVIQLHERWDPHDESSYSAYEGPNGVVLCYSPMLADQAGFRDAADWVDPAGVIRRIAGMVVVGYKRWEQGEDVEFVVHDRGEVDLCDAKTMRIAGRQDVCAGPLGHTDGNHEYVSQDVAEKGRARLGLPTIEIVGKGQRAVQIA